MNLFFDVLWLEDNNIWYGSQLKALNSDLESKNVFLRPEYYDDVDKFYDKITQEGSKFFHKYDLILVDFNLSSDKLTGIDVLKKIKEEDVYCDIIFYSQNQMDDLLKEIKNSIENSDNLHDGVYISDRQNIRPKFLKLLDKNLKRSNNLAEIRGALMDITSEFDFIMKEGVKILFNKLKPEDKKEIISEAERACAAAKRKSDKNFAESESAIKKCNIGPIVNSIYYVMDTKDRYLILDSILKKLNIDLFSKNLLSEYNEEIIKHRHTMAHKRISIAPCGEFLICCDNLKEFLSCSCKLREDDLCNNTHNDDLKISHEKVTQLRAKLFRYYASFDNLFSMIRDVE